MLALSCREGVTVSLGFFQDIFIPEQYMQSPGSMYDASRQAWFWKFDAETLWLDKGEQIRFKVREVRFQKMPTPAEVAKQKPTRPGAPTTLQLAAL
jgi:DNA-directed RNA polymerase III subunit RPC8